MPSSGFYGHPCIHPHAPTTTIHEHTVKKNRKDTLLEKEEVMLFGAKGTREKKEGG